MIKAEVTARMKNGLFDAETQIVWIISPAYQKHAYMVLSRSLVGQTLKLDGLVVRMKSLSSGNTHSEKTKKKTEETRKREKS